MRHEEFEIMFRAEDTHWWYRGLRGVMFELLELDKARPKSLSVLDAGCGTGANMQALKTAGVCQVEGFDLNESALHFCHVRGICNARKGSITAIPFPDASFDVVISCDVLNDAGTSNEKLALAELFRVLKPGGKLFLNLPAYSFLRSEHDIATDVQRRYTKGEISRKLRRTGFRVRRATYWDMLLFPVVVAVRLTRRSGARKSQQDARSDIVLPSHTVNRVLTFVLTQERRLVRRLDLPFGSSVAVVATKPLRA